MSSVRSRSPAHRRGANLFIDARKLGHLVDRTRREFSDADVARIADTYHRWRGGRFLNGTALAGDERQIRVPVW